MKQIQTVSSRSLHDSGEKQMINTNLKARLYKMVTKHKPGRTWSVTTDMKVSRCSVCSVLLRVAPLPTKK